MISLRSHPHFLINLCGFHCNIIRRMLMTEGADRSDHSDVFKEREKRQDVICRQRVIDYDTEDWQKSRAVAKANCDAGNDVDSQDSDDVLRYIAGIDMSTLKHSENADCIATVCLVVCKLPNLEVIYQSCELTEVSVPYKVGLLSYREGPVLIQMFRKLQSDLQNVTPQVVMVDGNGMLHPKGCGLACYVGTELDVPCIGVAKNLLHVDGITNDVIHKGKIMSMNSKGDCFPLIGSSGNVMGMALKPNDVVKRPLYVSVGHKISLETATWVTSMCCRYRVPEPIRQADIISREMLRDLYPAS